jgi:hypothetical protein
MRDESVLPKGGFAFHVAAKAYQQVGVDTDHPR